MTKLIRACVALVAFALTSALFAGEIDTYISSGQHVEISIAGTVGADIFVVNTDTGQTVVQIAASPYNPGSWNTDYYYNGGPTQSGSIQFTVNSPSSATITGLPAGNYQILCGSGNMYDYYSSQSGDTYYISQTNTMQTDWLDFSFEIW